MRWLLPIMATLAISCGTLPVGNPDSNRCQAPVLPMSPLLTATPAEDGVNQLLPDTQVADLIVYLDDVRRSREALLTCPAIDWIP